MRRLVICAVIAAGMSMADWTELTNRVEVLWTAHTNRIQRIEARRRAAEAARGNVNGRAPVKPFRAKKENPPVRPSRAKGVKK